VGEAADLYHRAWDAVRRREMNEILDCFSSDAEFRAAILSGAEGEALLRGTEGVRSVFETMFDTWERFEARPIDLKERGSELFAVMELNVSGRESGVDLRQPYVQILTAREGRIARLWNYLDIDEARADWKSRAA
jgi:ketosteroid isomerase-like protein